MQASGKPLDKDGQDPEKMTPPDPRPSPAPAAGQELPVELSLSRQERLSYTQERLEIDQELELQRTKSKPISLRKSADGTILVDWYTTDDPANPQNWSQRKKIFVLTQIWYILCF